MGWAAIQDVTKENEGMLRTFLREALLRPFREGWTIKTEAEKQDEITKWGKEGVQQKIENGAYAGCLQGNHLMIIEALSGIHPFVPLAASSQDIYNQLLLLVPKVAQSIKEEREKMFFLRRLIQKKPVSQFWNQMQKGLNLKNPNVKKAWGKLQREVPVDDLDLG